MSKVLWHTTMSLDGFIAGPDHAMDWMFQFTGEVPEAAEVIETTGAILCGRRGYELGRQRGWEAYGGAWTGPQFCLTRRPSDPEYDPAVTFSDDVRAAVGMALAAAGGKNVVVFGAETARLCLDEGLIDEVLIHVAPVLLGDGVRLFQRTGGQPVGLEKVAVTEAGQLTTLRFRVPASGPVSC